MKITHVNDEWLRELKYTRGYPLISAICARRYQQWINIDHLPLISNTFFGVP